jgi:hypothetical protein
MIHPETPDEEKKACFADFTPRSFANTIVKPKIAHYNRHHEGCEDAELENWRNDIHYIIDNLFDELFSPDQAAASATTPYVASEE